MTGLDFFAVAESSPDFVALAWPDNRVAYVNPAGRRLVGLESLDEARRHPITSYLTEAARRASVAVEQPAVLERGFWQGRSTLRHFGSGEAIAVEITSFLVRDAQTGEPRLLATFQRDIRRQVELEQQVSRAQKLETIGEVAGGVAHDFNNLLTAVVGNADLLLLDEEDQTRREILASIRMVGERGAQITRQLLTLARRDVAQLEPVELGALLAETLPMLRSVVSEHVRIDLRESDGLDPVVADRSQLVRALVNLTMNASDAMPEGGTVHVWTEPRALSEGRPGIGLFVRDSGQGIPAQHLARVTEPFFTTKGRGGGTGLGLAVVSGFLEEAGGEMSIESEEAVGTTVTIVLPVSSASEPVHEPPAVRSLRGDEAVLVVEDDEHVLRVIAQALDAHGYDVTVAQDGPSALEELERVDALDIVVTDMVIPYGSGRSVAEYARSARRDLPVLVISGYVDNADTRAALSAAEFEFLPKPFGPTDLLRRVRGMLDSR